MAKIPLSTTTSTVNLSSAGTRSALARPLQQAQHRAQQADCPGTNATSRQTARIGGPSMEVGLISLSSGSFQRPAHLAVHAVVDLPSDGLRDVRDTGLRIERLPAARSAQVSPRHARHASEAPDRATRPEPREWRQTRSRTDRDREQERQQRRASAKGADPIDCGGAPPAGPPRPGRGTGLTSRRLWWTTENTDSAIVGGVNRSSQRILSPARPVSRNDRMHRMSVCAGGGGMSVTRVRRATRLESPGRHAPARGRGRAAGRTVYRPTDLIPKPVEDVLAITVTRPASAASSA